MGTIYKYYWNDANKNRLCRIIERKKQKLLAGQAGVVKIEFLDTGQVAEVSKRALKYHWAGESVAGSTK